MHEEENKTVYATAEFFGFLLVFEVALSIEDGEMLFFSTYPSKARKSCRHFFFFVTLNWAEKGQQLIIYQHGWNLNQNVVFSAQRKACICCCYSMNALNLTGCQRSVQILHTIWYCVHFDTIRTARRWYKTHSHYLWTDLLFVRRILISRALRLIACLITSCCSSLRQSMAWEFNYLS